MRVYQEAMEEGKKAKAARTIVNMAIKNVPPEEIAAMAEEAEEEVEFVRAVYKAVYGTDNGNTETNIIPGIYVCTFLASAPDKNGDAKTQVVSGNEMSPTSPFFL